MITKEQLLATTTKIINIEKLGEVKIRKLKVGEINSASREKSLQKQGIILISLSLVDPQLSVNEANELPTDIALRLQDEILDFNGMSEKSANEIEKN